MCILMELWKKYFYNANNHTQLICYIFIFKYVLYIFKLKLQMKSQLQIIIFS